MIKKIIASIIILIIVISINTGVLAMSTAVRTSTMTTMMITTSAVARRNRNTYTIDKAIEEIYNETQSEELKTYITENKQYLYLDNKSKAETIINKYKESNLEETKQFIQSNYYDEDKPKGDKIIAIFLIIILVAIIVIAITAIISVMI